MKPHVINFHITNRCNYQCKHCFARFNQRELPLDEAKRVIDAIEVYFKGANVKNPRINLAGGEPLIYPYIDEIIDYISSKGIKVSIITNGSLLTDEMIEGWAGKIETIGISIDAKSKETNEKIGRCTKNGPLDLTRLKSVCDKIHKLGIKLKINTVRKCTRLEYVMESERKDEITIITMDELLDILGTSLEELESLEPLNIDYLLDEKYEKRLLV